jgi:hypothetical protein
MVPAPNKKALAEASARLRSFPQQAARGAQHRRTHATAPRMSVNDRAQIADLSQLFAAQRLGGVEIGKPAFQISREITLAPTAPTVAILVLGKVKCYLIH